MLVNRRWLADCSMNSGELNLRSGLRRTEPVKSLENQALRGHGRWILEKRKGIGTCDCW